MMNFKALFFFIAIELMTLQSIFPGSSVPPPTPANFFFYDADKATNDQAQPDDGSPVPLEPNDRSLAAAVKVDQLLIELDAAVRKIAEFRALEKLASKSGVRVWILGGSASSLIHYVRWDILRKSGDRAFRASKFNYDFVQIFRSTQDIDLVIDGSPEDAALLEQQFREILPSPTIDLYTLHHNLSKRPAILSSNFYGQNSDSHSLGLVEITNPPHGECRVRSAQDFDNLKDPLFLTDAADGTISFLPKKTHSQTARAAQGLNPPTLSVIRYLTKVLSYGLKIRPDDFEALKKMVSHTKRVQADFEAVQNFGWLDRHAVKLITRSLDHERGWALLESLNLFKLLKHSGSDPLSRWLDRSPMPYQKIPTASHSAKKGIGLAHDTRTFAAYESMTASPTRRSPLFISRPGKTEEAAVHGAGFYLSKGNTGAHGSPHTVLFELDPNASLQTEFQEIQTDWVLAKNLAALQLRDYDDTAHRRTYFSQPQDQNGIFHVNRRHILVSGSHTSKARFVWGAVKLLFRSAPQKMAIFGLVCGIGMTSLCFGPPVYKNFQHRYALSSLSREQKNELLRVENFIKEIQQTRDYLRLFSEDFRPPDQSAFNKVEPLIRLELQKLLYDFANTPATDLSHSLFSTSSEQLKSWNSNTYLKNPTTAVILSAALVNKAETQKDLEFIKSTFLDELERTGTDTSYIYGLRFKEFLPLLSDDQILKTGPHLSKMSEAALAHQRLLIHSQTPEQFVKATSALMASPSDEYASFLSDLRSENIPYFISKSPSLSEMKVYAKTIKTIGPLMVLHQFGLEKAASLSEALPYLEPLIENGTEEYVDEVANLAEKKLERLMTFERKSGEAIALGQRLKKVSSIEKLHISEMQRATTFEEFQNACTPFVSNPSPAYKLSLSKIIGENISLAKKLPLNVEQYKIISRFAQENLGDLMKIHAAAASSAISEIEVRSAISPWESPAALPYKKALEKESLSMILSATNCPEILKQLKR